MITRRQAIKTTALAGAALAAAPSLFAQTNPPVAVAPAAPAAGPFTLPKLPYAFDALEPHIDARTMEIHHDKHHAAYVANLNKAVASLERTIAPSIETLLTNLAGLPENIRTAVRNNGGGHYNHSLFWQMMKPGGGGEPTGELGKKIDKCFGSFGAFKELFTKAALGQFGSGWAWLVYDGGQLQIESTPNQDSPISQLMSGDIPGPCGSKMELNGRFMFQTPLLGLDVWEHAYYLKFQNKRADYITAWWNVVNWDFVAERYAKLKG